MADPTWPNDNQLHDFGYALGRKILQMYDKVGIPIDVPAYPGGAPSPDAGDTIVEGVVLDAEDYTSLDPQKITDAYFTLQGMAAATAGDESEARQNVKIAGAKLSANWHGDAAIAFARQMGYIEGFMDKQRDFYLYAVQALGIAFSLSVQVRESFISLAENTMEACNQVIDEQNKKDTEANIGLGAEIVQAGIDLVSMDKLKDLAKWGIEKILEGTENKAKESLDASGAPQVVASYIRSRDRLRGSSEAGLLHLKDWLNTQKSGVEGNQTGILEPLPVECDIDSPDFSYDKFFNENHNPEVFSPKVEQEHQKHMQEQQEQQPPGVIGQRLDGAGE